MSGLVNDTLEVERDCEDGESPEKDNFPSSLFDVGANTFLRSWTKGSDWPRLDYSRPTLSLVAIRLRMSLKHGFQNKLQRSSFRKETKVSRQGHYDTKTILLDPYPSDTGLCFHLLMHNSASRRLSIKRQRHNVRYEGLRRDNNWKHPNRS